MTQGIETVQPNQKILLTKEEAAELCSLKTRTFIAKVSRGEIPRPVLGGQPGRRGSRWSRLQLEEHFQR